jgi:hypothetical protein
MSERATKALGGQDRCEHQRLAAEVDPQNPALDDQRLRVGDWDAAGDTRMTKSRPRVVTYRTA